MQACPSPNPPPQNHCNPCRPCMMHSWQPIHRRWKSDCLHLRWIRARFSTPVGFSLRTRTMRDNMDPCRSVGLYQRTNLHAKLTYGWNFQEHIYIQKQVTSCHISHRISQFRRQRTPVPVPCSVPPWYMHSQTQTAIPLQLSSSAPPPPLYCGGRNDSCKCRVEKLAQQDVYILSREAKLRQMAVQVSPRLSRCPAGLGKKKIQATARLVALDRIQLPLWGFVDVALLLAC
jgi:hypothetical protein